MSNKLGGKNIPNQGRGRPKGAQNKTTKRFRDIINDLIENNAENVPTWLNTVANGDPGNGVKPDPKGALDLLGKLAEFAAPKLSRTEIVGDPDNPLHTHHTIDATKLSTETLKEIMRAKDANAS